MLDQRSFNDKSFDSAKSDFVNSLSKRELSQSPFLHCDRKDFASTLAKIELFKKVLNVKGDIIECGVHKGNSLMLFEHLSSIYEPYNFNRKIIGFDSFEGFHDFTDKDPTDIPDGAMGDSSVSVLEAAIELSSLNRPIGHIKKTSIVVGDARTTIKDFVNKNSHLLISLLYLDFDMYEPTLEALKHLAPLVVKGGIIAFDQLAQERWPGETYAFKEIFDAREVEIKSFTFEPHISYLIV